VFSKRWKSRAAILTTLGTILAITLLVWANRTKLAQTLSAKLATFKCSEVELQQYVEQLDEAEPAAFDALVGCNSRAVPALIKALRETQDEEVRIITIAALGEIGVNAAPAIPVFNELLKDKNEDVQRVIVHSLGQMGKEAIPVLISALKYQADVRFRAIDKLGKFGKEAVPILIAALDDADSKIRSGAAGAVGEIGRFFKTYYAKLSGICQNNRALF